MNHSMQVTVPAEKIVNNILLIRGKKVMLDSDLAELYGIPVKVLIQAIKRNKARFPEHFMFQLNDQEFVNLRSQIVTSSWGGRRYAPYAFTEHGVIMLSSVLKSQRAIEISVLVVDTFIKLREILSSNNELAHKIEALERNQKNQNKHINTIYSILGKLMDEPIKPRGPVGF
ncbi:MAG: ORF6N domain-containing protein [Patescibacteria group bacterium]